MRNWMRVGCLVLGASAVACGGQFARTPVPLGADEAPDVASSSGGGGSATVDTGRFPFEDEGDKDAGAKRALYGQVARELGMKRGLSEGLRDGMGGAGLSAQEKRLCTDALNAREKVTVVSGIISFRTNGLVVVDVPGTGPVKLRTDDVTCAVQSGKAQSPLSLSEGTEARVSYVEDAGGFTARVIRAEPMRPTR